MRTKQSSATTTTATRSSSSSPARRAYPPWASCRPSPPGEKLKITGDWVEHPIYGKQIKVSHCEIEKPTTLSGIEKYLSSGMIRGIGPATAKLLIKAFGEETLDVLYSDPQRLLDVPGIGPKRAQMIMESYAEQAQQREAMVFLQSYGVTPNLAVKIFKRYGENVKQVIHQNPYRLVEDIEGVGLIATLNVIGIPFEIPPFIPPLLFVLVFTFSPS